MATKKGFNLSKLSIHTKVFIVIVIIIGAAIILGGAPQTAQFFKPYNTLPTNETIVKGTQMVGTVSLTLAEQKEIGELKNVGVSYVGYTKSYAGTASTLPTAINYGGKTYAIQQTSSTSLKEKVRSIGKQNVMQIGVINEHPIFFVGSQVYVVSDVKVNPSGNKPVDCVCLDCINGGCYNLFS